MGDHRLKPCPFCGGEAKFLRIAGDYGYTADTYMVGCQCCGATIKKSTGYCNLTDSVIEAWNRRVKDE